ncbi:DUF1330 domain-containing protein [Gordonia sp. SID5947]|uniref:DUF1330 domain-containing protein n=1 Tax=Gordonia sp. SID5947 TaxID=2690315 RepID=UPI00136C54A6|nr:DUF1330 domain-containing protein [Gordonia sp. SID5947]MYR08228.1 DUF1330 domain-containing protein [Gordonia sp. SID5947]
MSTDLPPADRRAVDPHRGQFGQLSELPADQPITMLNLLRFRDEADYSQAAELAPQQPISGEDAYRIYGRAATPHLEKAGAEVVFHGDCGPTVIGPVDEQWDSILLVRYPNPAAFRQMVTDPEYQSLARHRTAAIADSRRVATTV